MTKDKFARDTISQKEQQEISKVDSIQKGEKP
jgi:hypothetical protein